MVESPKYSMQEYIFLQLSVYSRVPALLLSSVIFSQGWAAVDEDGVLAVCSGVYPSPWI